MTNDDIIAAGRHPAAVYYLREIRLRCTTHVRPFVNNKRFDIEKYYNTFSRYYIRLYLHYIDAETIRTRYDKRRVHVRAYYV